MSWITVIVPILPFLFILVLVITMHSSTEDASLTFTIVRARVRFTAIIFISSTTFTALDVGA
jgi:hypothetical protein